MPVRTIGGWSFLQVGEISYIRPHQPTVREKGAVLVMKQSLVNIFVYGDGTHIHAVGWRVYEKAGSYEELTNFLQSRVQHDH